MVLENQLTMANLVHRDYSKEFVKVGDSITIRKPARFSAKNFTGQVHSQNITLATLLLVPAAFSLFAMYSPMVVLGQTYLEKNVGLASGVTMGLGTTLGGVAAPIVGWAADQWGIGFALQILWIAALFGAVFSFLLPRIHR